MAENQLIYDAIKSIKARVFMRYLARSYLFYLWYPTHHILHTTSQCDTTAIDTKDNNFGIAKLLKIPLNNRASYAFVDCVCYKTGHPPNLKHTTTLFSLYDHYILSREWRVIVDLVQTDYHGRPMVSVRCDRAVDYKVSFIMSDVF